MTPLETVDSKRIARVLRAARKLAGKTQREVADSLELSQSALSKMETGRSIPSSSQWFHFCREQKIDAQFSFDSGLIDQLQNVRVSSEVPSNFFQIPKKYLRYRGSSVRASRPFLNFFSAALGEEKLLDYFKSVDMDADFFSILDLKLCMTFNLDLMTTLIQKGALRRDNLPEVTHRLHSAEVHGRLHDRYLQISDPTFLIRQLVDNIDRYDTNFTYRFIYENLGFGLMTLAITPAEHLRLLPYRNDTLGNFVCEYKKEYIRQFCSYRERVPVEIRELECHFRGNARCLYQIQIQDAHIQRPEIYRTSGER